MQAFLRQLGGCWTHCLMREVSALFQWMVQSLVAWLPLEIRRRICQRTRI